MRLALTEDGVPHRVEGRRTMTLHLTGPALRFFETLRSLQPARQVNAVVRPQKRLVHRMATNSRAVRKLAIANVMVGGIALLGWVAMALLAIFDQLPQDWRERLRLVDDLAFFMVLLCGP